MASTSVSFRERQKIAAKMKKQQVKEHANEICWHCSNKIWRDYHENRDLNGVPITLNCPFREGNILRSSPACEHFSE